MVQLSQHDGLQPAFAGLADRGEGCILRVALAVEGIGARERGDGGALPEGRRASHSCSIGVSGAAMAAVTAFWVLKKRLPMPSPRPRLPAQATGPVRGGEAVGGLSSWLGGLGGDGGEENDGSEHGLGESTPLFTHSGCGRRSRFQCSFRLVGPG